MSDFESTVRTLARKYALENAAKFGGKANPGAVIGKVMAEGGDAVRARGKEVPALAQAVIAEVNAMPPEEQKAAFAQFEGQLIQRAKVERDGPLKPLPNATKGKVVLRLAPNPSGPPHFGHGRGMVITEEYRRMYDGQFILRFDDTDTTVKPPWMPAYEMFPETVEWLCGRKPDRILFASDHVETYYQWAHELIRRGGGYVCECVGDAFRELKEKALPCPHRDQTPEVNAEKFQRMVDGGYRRGEAVLRVKTDIAHKDPAMRDWVAFRIAEEPHPRLEKLGRKQHHAWPLLDFQSAIDDHLAGVTHIIRGKDLRDSTGKQEFLYRHLGWTYPETMYWGRVSVHEFGKFSKSILNKAIEAGEFTGWDDPRLPTFPALKRRGFTAEGIRNFWLSFGITEKDIAASIVTLEAENKKVLEPSAHRYFFVADAKVLHIQGAPKLHARPALLPDKPAAGVREIDVPDGHVLVAAEDLRDGPLRLKDLANVTVSGGVARHEGDDIAWARQHKAPIVQWVPAPGIPATLVTPENERVEGFAEPALAKEPVGAHVQLERLGFARVDEKRADGSVVLYFTHK
ncbi:MAG TPA: glutamate--tRNA ligase [Candidatus Thermoplasmatota archaeon]|nr:glutamate--tRNA ligase [Candidatus Thermoplasmatota archaeon]